MQKQFSREVSGNGQCLYGFGVQVRADFRKNNEQPFAALLKDKRYISYFRAIYMQALISMRHLLLAATIAIILCCCESGKRRENTSTQAKTANPDRKSDKDTIIIKKLTSLQFPLFWPAFRRAVLEKDTATLLRLTHFPFETRGESDDDPVVRYEQADFLRLYPLLLSQPTGLSPEGKETELDLVRTTSRADSLRPTEDFARLGALEFRKIEEEWKFASAYLTDETMEKMKKK